MTSKPQGAVGRENAPHAFVLRFHSIYFRRFPDARQYYPDDLRAHVFEVTPVFLDVAAQLRYPELLGEAVSVFVQAHTRICDDPAYLKSIGETLIDVLAMFCGERWNRRMESTLWRIYLHYARRYAARPEPPQVTPERTSAAPEPGEVTFRTIDREPAEPELDEEPDAPESLAGVSLDEDELRVVPLIVDRTPKGSLADRPLTQLLFSLHKANWTGTLVLTGEQTLEVEWIEGKIGASAGNRDPRERLAAAFSWSQGRYELDPDRVPDEQTFEDIGDTETFVFKATESRVALNQAALRMQDLVSMYPAFTSDALARLENLGKPPLLTMLCQMCDGSRTLQALLETTWTDAQAMVRCAYYAAITNLVVMQPVATRAPVQVTYANLRGAGGDRPTTRERRRTSVPAPPKVRLTLEEAYKTMGLTPGCGTTAVNKAFVKLAARGLATRPKVMKAFEMLIEAEPTQAAMTPAEDELPAARTETSRATEARRRLSKLPIPRRSRGRTAPLTAEATDTMPRRSAHTKTKIRPPRPRRENVRDAAIEAARRPMDREAVTPPGDVTPTPSPRDTGPRGARAARPAKRPHPQKVVSAGEEAFNEAARNLDRNRRVEALMGFTKACELEPDNLVYRTELLWVSYLCNPTRAEEMLSDLRGIRAPLEDSWDADDMFLRCRCNLVCGRIYKAEGKEEEALRCFSQASQDNPKCIESRREERLCHMRQNGEANDSWLKRLLKKEIG